MEFPGLFSEVLPVSLAVAAVTRKQELHRISSLQKYLDEHYEDMQSRAVADWNANTVWGENNEAGIMMFCRQGGGLIKRT